MSSSSRKRPRPSWLLPLSLAVAVGLVAAGTPTAGRTAPAAPRTQTNLAGAAKKIHFAKIAEENAIRNPGSERRHELLRSDELLDGARADVKSDVTDGDLEAGTAAPIISDIREAREDDAAALADIKKGEVKAAIDLIKRALTLKESALHKIVDAESKTTPAACTATITAGPPQPPLIGNDFTLTCHPILASFDLKLPTPLVGGDPPAGTKSKSFDRVTNKATFVGPWPAGTKLSFSVLEPAVTCPYTVTLTPHFSGIPVTPPVSSPLGIKVTPCK